MSGKVTTMRRLLPLLPWLGAAACPSGEKFHHFADVTTRTGGVRCAAAKMTSLGYVVQDLVDDEFGRRVWATKRDGESETMLLARGFVFAETGVRRLSVSVAGVTSLARADAQAVLDACGTPDAS